MEQEITVSKTKRNITFIMVGIIVILSVLGVFVPSAREYIMGFVQLILPQLTFIN